MTDIVDRLVRFAGKVCLSTDTEIEAASEIERLRAENEKLRAERDTIGEANYVSGWNDAINSSEAMQDLRAENEKLRAALKPFADEASVGPMPGEPDDPRRCNMKFLRAAAAALKEANND